MLKLLKTSKSHRFFFILTLSAFRILQFYRLICSHTRDNVTVQLAWSGAHPATLPTLLYSCYTSVGQTLLSLLYLCTWSSGSIGGLVWTSILRRWWRFLPWMTSWTRGIWKSVWRVWLETNHGAFAISRRIFHWNLDTRAGRRADWQGDVPINSVYVFSCSFLFGWQAKPRVCASL
jgi:hypothetical protein